MGSLNRERVKKSSISTYRLISSVGFWKKKNPWVLVVLVEVFKNPRVNPTGFFVSERYFD